MIKSLVSAAAAVLAAAGLALAFAAAPAKAAVWSAIYASNSNYCLTSSTTAAPGSPVYIYQCFGNSNQLWYDLGVSDGGWGFEYGITYQGHFMCLADTGGATGDGVQFELWYCENSPVPYWEDFFTASEGGGWNRFLVSHTGVDLAVQGGTYQNYQPVITWHDIPHATYEEFYKAF